MSPESTEPPEERTSDAAVSKMVVPVRSVCRKASSSAKATVEIRSQSRHERGIALGHLVAAHREQLGKGTVLVPEQPHGPHRSPQQPAQDVAAPLVAGSHAVADEHHRAADVVGDHAEPHVVVGARSVAPAAELLGLLDDRVHHVDLVHVRLALEQEGDPLQTHAGVDVLLRQRPDDVEVRLAPDRAELVLHEDEVPDLQVAVLGGEVTLSGAVLRAAVVEDLRTRATRSGNAHRPVVLALARGG